MHVQVDVLERKKQRPQPTHKHIIPNLHGIVVDCAPTHPAGGLDDAAGRDDGAAPDADAGGRDLLARRRGHRPRRVQVAAQVHVGHDDGAAT